jgi:DNA-binding CsgD family transcriptional regulator
MAATLRAADVRRLTEALESLAAVKDVSAFPSAALAASCAVVPCEVATYNEVHPQGSLVVWRPEDVARPAGGEELLTRFAGEHPLVQRMLRTGDGSPAAISDFLTQAQFQQLNLYRLVYGPMGLADQMAIGLPAPRPLVIGIALNRDRRGFDERDRLLANLIRPYLVQTHRCVHLAASLEAASALALDNRVAAFVSADGRVESLQGSFPSWFPAQEVFPNGRLDDEARGWLAAHGKVRRDESELPALTRPLIRQAAGARWALRQVLTDAGRVVVASRSSLSSGAQEGIFRSLGLTEREASVLKAMCQGATNGQIAAQLAITLSGVKRHVESIYRKLGVRRRSEATALAVDTIANV